MMEKARNLKAQIERNKRDIAIVAGWIVVTVLILVRSHMLFYIENPGFFYQKVVETYYGLVFSDFDRLLLVVTSFVVGIVLIDVKKLVYGYFAAMILSFSVALTYVFLFNWFTLGLGKGFSKIYFGWEWVLFAAFRTVFRFMFPTGMIFCLLGVIAGNFIRIMLQP